MVFALQKYGFYRAKRWFLHCKKWVFVLPTINIRGTITVLVLYEHYVTANRSPRNWQTVRSIIAIRSQPYGRIYRARVYECTHRMAIRQQCFGNPFAAVGVDLSCPHIRKHPQNGNPSAMFWHTVRSRRGRFIVPAYMKTPTK